MVRLVSILTYIFIAFTHVAKADSVHFVTETLRPLQFEDEFGVKGMAVDVVRLAAKRSHLEFDISIFDWTRAYQLALSRKNTCLFSVARLPSREKEFHWLGVISGLKATLFKHKDRKNIEINTIADAKQYGVMVVSNDAIHHYFLSKGFEDNKQIYLVSSRDTMLELAFNKPSSPLLVYDPLLLGYWADLQKRNKDHLVPLLTIGELTVDFYLACNKNTNEKIVSKLKEQLSAIRSSGEYDRILEGWRK